MRFIKLSLLKRIGCCYSPINFMRSVPRPPLFSTFLSAAIALAMPLLSPSARANLVANGGFEAGAVADPAVGGTAVGGGATATINGDLSSWDVGPSSNFPNVLATNQNGYYGGAPNGGPHTGDLAAVFPNFPEYDGYISQAVSGVVGGSIYKIGFWLSNQVGDLPDNYMSVKWGGYFVNPGDALSGGYSLSGDGGNPANPTLPGAIPVPTNWTHYEFTVGAPSDNARLTFIGGHSSAGNLIDDVTVDFIAVPEVSSFGMVMGLGLLALGTLARIRRRSLATV